MKLKLYRAWANDNETLGMLSIDNVEECFTLEDQYQDIKVYGETRIPPGTYKVILRKQGRLHIKYSELFPFHKGMLHLIDVPGFSWIYIHKGLTDLDSKGCLLVGRQSKTQNGKITLVSSTDAYTSLYKRVVQSALDDNLYIQII